MQSYDHEKFIEDGGELVSLEFERNSSLPLEQQSSLSTSTEQELAALVERKAKRLHRIKYIMMTVVFGSLLAVGILSLVFPKIRQHLLEFLVWFQDDPLIKFPVYSLITTAAVLLGFPLMFFEVLAGYLFPVVIVIPTILFERLLIVNAGFLISRYLLHDTLGLIIERKPSIRTFKKAVHAEEVKFLTLAQLAYIPFWMKTYGLPLFVKTKKLYVAIALICSAPTSTVYILIGAQAVNFNSVATGECFKHTHFKGKLILIGLLALALFITYSIWLSKKIKRELSKFEDKTAISSEIDPPALSMI
mmetsp:Transcript_53201/g.60977  ORF Transcript_53201/g.60977 Transcript_53201/m.60977 type:complete len:304 (+) Transcript_53201:583-1494(+)|eukprot:CAMPEP_0114978422 /NCGR_PEP_ID=MMETSP0216-20121206/3798_1 /TAXON_ID=223996 /ORGANISM="Protocruzia adherens, Strain Boccale" /LENGTH=303 /DNA_ID=CAMNT_0002339617 /DNA_START=448 /DNA_END=1359 /DNA_ORIENTATION=-